MDVQQEDPSDEIKRLRRCMNDLLGVLTLPAVWVGSAPAQIVRTLLDVLLGMLHLDLVYVQLKDPLGETPLEMLRLAHAAKRTAGPDQLTETIRRWLASDARKSAPLGRDRIGDGDITVVPLRLGLQGEIGTIVAGSTRADFPGQTETLLLSVAANQAAIGLQEARLLGEQKRVASELDRRVKERTRELAAANAELRRSEAFLVEGQRLSSTGTFSWRVATDEITWSDELYRIFGFEHGAPVTLEMIRSRFHPEDIAMLDDMIERGQGCGSGFEYEHRLMMPDRSVKYLHLIAHGAGDEHGRPEYIGAVQDVTQRRLSEMALSEARSELAHVTRVTTLGVLTASIAHEVNQPLAAIVTNGEVGLRWLAGPQVDLEELREVTQSMVADARRASAIIDRIRAMASRRPPERAPLSLDDVIEGAMAFLRHELQIKGVAVALDLAPALPQVIGDRTQLQQVIVNLTINAVQAVMQAEVGRRSILLRTMLADPAMVCCAIEDSGPGIDPEHHPYIFEGFFTTKAAGMGMGLAISRSIIEAHDGRMSADNHSAFGGARFCFALPAHVASPGPAATRADAPL